jgi:hypothetical protein
LPISRRRRRLTPSCSRSWRRCLSCGRVITRLSILTSESYHAALSSL